MISKIKKFFLYIFFLLFFIILFVASTYSFLVYKPDHGIKFIDKVLLLDYSLKIKSTSSNKNLINPFFIFEEIQINDNENKELVYIPNLKIGVNLIESLIQEYLSLSVLEIDKLKSSQGSSMETFQPFLIKGNKLKISNNTIDISAKGFELLISPNNSKIILIKGNINTYSYTQIKAFIDSLDNKLFYESSHSFDSNALNQINSIDLSSLKDHDIYVDLDTKGYIDFETNQNNRFDRLTFKNSSITTNSEFLIKDINSSVFSDLNKELLGVFKSKLPDQNISGSISYDYKRSVIRTNLTINMGGIIDSNRYFSMDGDEIFRSIMILSKDNFSMNLLSNLSNTNTFSLGESRVARRRLGIAHSGRICAGARCGRIDNCLCRSRVALWRLGTAHRGRIFAGAAVARPCSEIGTGTAPRDRCLIRGKLRSATFAELIGCAGEGGNLVTVLCARIRRSRLGLDSRQG